MEGTLLLDTLSVPLKEGYNVLLRGPSRPFNISWRYGSVEFKGWKAPGLFYLQEGRAILKGTGGKHRLHLWSGQLRVTDHEGPLVVDSYALEGHISKLKGDLSLYAFRGRSFILDVVGKIDLFSQGSKMHIQGGSGALAFQNHHGNMDLSLFKGPIRGDTQQGAIKAKLASPGDITISTVSGNIRVEKPPDSGAWVRIEASRKWGSISAPSYLKRTLLSDRSSVRVGGRLKGKQREGNIRIKSKEGKITLQ